MYGQNNKKDDSVMPDAEIISNSNDSNERLSFKEKPYCAECDITYEEEYEFCPECGGRLTVKREPISSFKSELNDLKKCPNCGYEASKEYIFCPNCGKSLDEENASTGNNKSQVRSAIEDDSFQNTETAIPPQTNYRQNPVQKTKSNKKWIILGALAAAIIIIIIFINMTSTKSLILNSGDDIDIYVGDTKKIEVVGDGLDAVDYQSIVLYPDNEEVLTVKNNKKIKAKYDSESFNAISVDDEGNEDTDICSCTTYLNAHLEKGIRKWEGRVKVNISIEPKKLENGKIIKKPTGDQLSSLAVTASDNYNAYIYLKSKTKKSNDMSFTVKKGKEATVGVPADEYDLYWAAGDTWYGSKFLFGPDTEYNKTEDEWDFRQYTWTFQMGVENGNLNNESVDEDDFPEL